MAFERIEGLSGREFFRVMPLHYNTGEESLSVGRLRLARPGCNDQPLYQFELLKASHEAFR